MSNINLSFMGVQPIELSISKYTKLIQKKIHFNALANIARKKYTSKWLQEYTRIYDVYQDLYEFDISVLNVKLNSFFEINLPQNANGENINISKYLKSYSAKLYFDPRFVYFIVIYDIEFEIPEQLLSFFEYDSTKDNVNKHDFYNTIRNAFVREEESSQISKWAVEVEKKIYHKVQEVIHQVYKVSLEENDIKILPNTCNITNFIEAPQYIEKIAQKFIASNLYAERLTSDFKLDSYYDETVYYSFNGRFHTVVFKSTQDRYRFYPLQFHIQYMWFLVEQYNKIMNFINKQLMQTDSLKTIQSYSILIHAMINKIELLSLHDMNFKHSIEVDMKIYTKNEERWYISNLLDSAKQYVSFFKDYLERIFVYKNSLFQKKLNMILVFISFLQLLALISVWNDYLSLLDEKAFDQSNLIFNIVNKDILMNFNFILPLLLMILMSGFVIYLWKHRAK